MQRRSPQPEIYLLLASVLGALLIALINKPHLEFVFIHLLITDMLRLQQYLCLSETNPTGLGPCVFY